jgi:hypothetical protein
MLSKEDMLVCAFYKLEYLSYLAVMLPKFSKSLFTLLNLVLVLIELVGLKQLLLS